MKDLEKKARAYALKNAISYKGKANQGAVISALFNEGLEKNKVKDVVPVISNIIKKVNSLSPEEQKKEFESIKEEISERQVREGLPEIPNTEKGIITRIAPSPSGAMHIGHALTASISYLYVKKYGGKFYVRIEDTNPDNIYEPAYKLLEEDSKWLFEGNAKIIIQSERMKIYYKYIKELIKKDSAYVCNCSSEDFKEFVKNKKNCPCRKLSVKENQEKWKKMLSKEGFKQGEVVLRFKSDMKHPNPAMRDFPLARINETEHPLQKNKYRVWPLMNLSVAIDDLELGITHIIRAKDHRDNAKRQQLIYKALEKENKIPWNAFLGRWHIKGLKLSSSQITKDIKEGKYSAWNDPKLPTLQVLKTKYKPQAFHKFAENRGLSEVDKTIDKKEFFRILDIFNKD
ncbi:MAG: glutamate--tRNA ligase family protein [Nanoarchaeota archaeon]